MPLNCPAGRRSGCSVISFTRSGWGGPDAGARSVCGGERHPSTAVECAKLSTTLGGHRDLDADDQHQHAGD